MSNSGRKSRTPVHTRTFSGSTAKHEKVKMRKELGLLQAITLILGIIFGSGIFISPKEVLQKTGSVWGSLTVWTICGALATLGALSYAELGTTLAQSGGDYHYINEAYGALPAFLYLWDANLVFVPSTNAIMSLTFANNLLQPIFDTCPIDPTCRKLIAAATICLLTFINAYDIKFTTRVQDFFTFTMIVALIMIVGGGVVWMTEGSFSFSTDSCHRNNNNNILGRLENFQDGWAGTKTSISDWSVAFFLGMFSYSGWNYLNFMTEELKDPFVNLPRAIYVSLPIVTAIYITTNVCYLAVLGLDVAHTEAIAVDFAAKALGWIKWIMPGLVAVATLGGLSVNIMTASRMCFAGARNGHMPEILAHINIRCMSPVASLLFLMLVSLLMLIPDNLTTLITYCSVVESFFTTLCCSAVLWLRYKKPLLLRPIRVQLWMPVVYVILTGLLLVVPAISEPVAVMSGVIMTVAGLPVFWVLVKRRPQCVNKISVQFTHVCQKLLFSAVEED